MKTIKQSTYESCLACSLLMLIEQDNKDEIDIWKGGWNFNYLIGQLNFVSEKYVEKLKAYIENTYYFNQLEKQKNNSVELVNEKIDLTLLRKLIQDNKVILYLDCYYLYGILHAPHFVFVLRETNNGVEIIDPGDGEIKIIPTKTIEEAVESLRNYLKYSPVLITLDK